VRFVSCRGPTTRKRFQSLFFTVLSESQQPVTRACVWTKRPLPAAVHHMLCPSLQALSSLQIIAVIAHIFPHSLFSCPYSASGSDSSQPHVPSSNPALDKSVPPPELTFATKRSNERLCSLSCVKLNFFLFSCGRFEILEEKRKKKSKLTPQGTFFKIYSEVKIYRCSRTLNSEMLFFQTNFFSFFIIRFKK